VGIVTYSGDMLEGLKQVERTRPTRLNQEYPRADAQTKDQLLQEFHPDYRSDSHRAAKIGPNKGDEMVNELVDLLEAYPRVELDMVPEAPAYEVDVLVIGGGGGGSSAALTALENGANVLVATKLRLGDANTMMAQGGIQAADKENDSPAIHYLDVMGGGHYYNKPELVRALVRDAPGVIGWLERLGCMLNKHEDGTMETIHGGGTSRKRMHFARDYSGAEIMRTLRDEVQNKEIPVIEFSPAVELLLDDSGACRGAVLYNLETEQYLRVHAQKTILATGGFGRLHVAGFPTTNHYGATADGLVMAYRAGANLLYMDASQFHPTGVAHPEQGLGLLVTEKVRGLGAQLVNREGNRFINELETRDVVSSAIIRECNRGLGLTTPTGRQGVWLDSPLIDVIHGEGTTRAQLPAMVRQYERFGIDMTKQPILIYPTLHYQNGGIEINENGETAVPNLYAAGESSGGVHGKNRLMGNSLLDILVFGRRAGKHAAQTAGDGERFAGWGLEHVESYKRELSEAGLEKGELVGPQLLPPYARRAGQRVLPY